MLLPFKRKDCEGKAKPKRRDCVTVYARTHQDRWFATALCVADVRDAHTARTQQCLVLLLPLLYHHPLRVSSVSPLVFFGARNHSKHLCWSWHPSQAMLALLSGHLIAPTLRSSHARFLLRPPVCSTLLTAVNVKIKERK